MLSCVNQRDNLRRGQGICFPGVLPGAISFLMAAATVAAWGQATPAATEASTSAPPVVITLEEAIHRAQASEPNYAASSANNKIASLDRSIAVAGLLPSVRLYNQDIHTQSNGLFSEGGEGVVSAQPKFVANDSRPNEFMAQGIAEGTLGLAGPAAVRRAYAASAQAAAEFEISRRGLISGVTVLFYGSLAADHKLTVAQTAREEAAAFTKLTGQREEAREVAHADVLKAQLAEQQRIREFQDAQIEAEKAKLELGVLLFPDPQTPYTLSAPENAAPLASKEDVQAAAAKYNPELKSALAALGVSKADVMTARAAYLPSAAFNLTYGIDANEFSVKGPLITANHTHVNNLGYSATVTVNLPVWDWLSTEHKVKQSEIKRDATKVSLTNTQRQVIAKLDEAYSEVAVARNQLDSLDQSAAIAAESLRLTKLAYTAGEATVLEVVDAQNSYVTAENAREDGRVRYETARANLQTITGTM